MAPPPGYPVAFPTLNSTPPHVFCFSCGRGRPLRLLTPVSSSLPTTPAVPAPYWALSTVERLAILCHLSVECRMCCPASPLCPREHWLLHLLPPLSKDTITQSHYYIFSPRETSFGSLFLELCPGCPCGIRVLEVGHQETRFKRSQPGPSHRLKDGTFL